jgi:hypothetical protein
MEECPVFNPSPHSIGRKSTSQVALRVDWQICTFPIPCQKLKLWNTLRQTVDVSRDVFSLCQKSRTRSDRQMKGIFNCAICLSTASNLIFKGIVSRDLHICFLVSIDRSEVPTPYRARWMGGERLLQQLKIFPGPPLGRWPSKFFPPKYTRSFAFKNFVFV